VRLEIKKYDGPHEEVAGWPQVEVTLSKRNLLALLAKVGMSGSARRIESRDSSIEGELAQLVLVVRCESDEVHYQGPRRRARGKPGRMHRFTAAFIEEHDVGGESRDEDRADSDAG
jgi:hypothetical protein